MKRVQGTKGLASGKKAKQLFFLRTQKQPEITLEEACVAARLSESAADSSFTTPVTGKRDTLSDRIDNGARMPKSNCTVIST